MSADLLAEVLTDLRAEGDRLDGLVADLAAEAWRTPTPAARWTVAHQIAHLTWTDDAALAATAAASGDTTTWDALVGAALEHLETFVDDAADRLAALEPADLLDRWRESRTRLIEALRDHSAAVKLPWFGPPMSSTSMATARFMETWAHGHDVTDALGRPLPPADSVRHVAHLGIRTRGFSYRNRDLEPPTSEVRVELELPSDGLLEHGPADAGQRVRGSAYDFALLVTQRAHRDDLDLVAEGADADEWLDLAQAFAGPPGPGRAAS